MAEKRWVELTKQEQSRQFVENRGEGFRLVVTATASSEMPKEIFLYRQVVTNPRNEPPATADEFLGVCSCIDLIEYPVDAPEESRNPAFFRKDHFDIVVPSQSLALEVWLLVLERAKILVESLNKLDYLGEERVVTIGEIE